MPLLLRTTASAVIMIVVACAFRSLVAGGAHVHATGSPAARCTMSLQDTSVLDNTGLNSAASSHLIDYSALPNAAAEGEGAAAGVITSQKPKFEALTELTMQAPGEVNPVTDWHNKFVGVGDFGGCTYRCA